MLRVKFVTGSVVPFVESYTFSLPMPCGYLAFTALWVVRRRNP
jgi:hypothetical protein